MKDKEIALRVGKNIKALRKTTSLNQTAFSEILGIERSYYAKMENGDRNVPIKVLLNIAKMFDVTTDYLLNEDHYEATMGTKLKFLIRASGKSAEIIAEEISKCGVKISKATMSDLINDVDKGYSYKFIIALARYFKVSTDYLLGLKDE